MAIGKLAQHTIGMRRGENTSFEERILSQMRPRKNEVRENSLTTEMERKFPDDGNGVREVDVEIFFFLFL